MIGRSFLWLILDHKIRQVRIIKAESHINSLVGNGTELVQSSIK